MDAAAVAAHLGSAFGAEGVTDEHNGMPAYHFERNGAVLVLQAFFGGWSLVVRRPGAPEKTLFAETAGDLVRELAQLGLVVR